MTDPLISIRLGNPGVAPQLLVSVRNLEEATIAHESGVDLIDLKEPNHGSLGMVELATAQQIAEALPQATLSLALGELADWKQSASMMQIPGAFRFLKMGLSGEVDNKNWLDEWVSLREKIDDAASKSFDWIAVIYADHELAKSPTPDAIIEAAIKTGCAGVLFDTWSKQAGSLLDQLSVDRLKAYRTIIHKAGIMTALAGSLRQEHLSELRPVEADVMAMRGAVCEENNRVGSLSPSRITAIQEEIRFPLGQQ